jgi:glycosyltransferase involved in cell wall biosynthesis
MSERPRISIVTPSFRPGPWLRLCVASVADQSDVELEHIIQDAGSDDGTLDWLRTEGGARVFVEKDMGMYDAVNRGLQRATGDIVAYLNCDEQYLPGVLAVVARFFAENPDVQALFGDALLVDVHGRALSYRRIIRPGLSHTRLDHLGTLSCAMFWRRELFVNGFRFPAQYRAIGDAVFVWSLLNAGHRTAALGEPIAAFTFTGANLGQTEAAVAEAKQWREEAGRWARMWRPAMVLAHRFRKAAAGAYRVRTVDYAIYTVDSPEKRVPFHADRLGWRWPNASN